MTNLPIDLRDLARERKSVEALAAHLLTDGHGGEDLAQESIVRLLRSGGPRGHGNRLAWLRRTVRRLAVNEFRATGNRMQREREVARPEATLSSAQIAERAELCASVHRAVDALPSEQANVLRDHYFGELSVIVIAERDGVSVNTVKSRIQRARAALRVALERDGIGGDMHWSIALAPLAASATHVTATVSTLAGAGGSALIMKNTVSFVVVLLALIVGVYFAVPDAEREIVPAHAAADATITLASPEDAAAPLAPTSQPASARMAATPSAPEGATHGTKLATCTLFGRVVGSDGGPLPDVLVQVSRVDRWSEVETENAVEVSEGRVGFTSTTDREGRFRFQVPFTEGASARLNIIPSVYRVLHEESLGDGREHALCAGDVDLGEVTLKAAGVISGRVVDAAGAPIAGAALRVAPSFHSSYAFLGKSTAVSALDGSFVLAHGPLGLRGVAIEADGYASRFDDAINIGRHGTTEVSDIILEALAITVLRGRVMDEDGRGIARQWVRAEPRARGDCDARGRTNSEGWFELKLRSASAHLLTVKRPGYVTIGGFVADAPYYEPTLEPIMIQLTPLPRVTFKLVDAGTGEAIEWFGINVLLDNGPKALRQIHSAGGSRPKQAEQDGGSLTIGVREGIDVVEVAARGYRPFRGDVEFDHQGEATQTIQLHAAARATGRVLVGGVPAAGASVKATRTTGNYLYRVAILATTAEDGSYVLDGLHPGLHRVTVQSEDGVHSGEATFEVGDQLAVEITEINLLRAGAIEGTVSLPPGVNPEGLSVVLDDWKDRNIVPLSTTGAFRIGDVRPGRHNVTLQDRAGELESVPAVAATVVQDQTARIEIDARDCGMARVTLTIDCAGVAPEDIQVRIVHDVMPSDAAQRERHWRSGITKTLERDDDLIRFTGRERASGRALIELRFRGGGTLILPEPVLLLEPFGVVEEHVDVTLATLAIEFPESLTIAADARIIIHLERNGHGEPLQSIRAQLEDGVLLYNIWSRGATWSGRTMTIGQALPGAFDLRVSLVSKLSEQPLRVLADGTLVSPDDGRYEVTVPVVCAPGQVTRVVLPDRP